jgi:hypothetical protein
MVGTMRDLRCLAVICSTADGDHLTETDQLSEEEGT